MEIARARGLSSARHQTWRWAVIATYFSRVRADVLRIERAVKAPGQFRYGKCNKRARLSVLLATCGHDGARR